MEIRPLRLRSKLCLNSPRLSVFTAIRPRDGEEMTAEVCERELLRIAEAVRQIWPELLPID